MALKDDHYTYRVTWAEEGPGVCWPVRRIPNFELLGQGARIGIKGSSEIGCRIRSGRRLLISTHTRESLKSGIVGGRMGALVSAGIVYFVIPFLETAITNVANNGVSGLMSGFMGGLMGLLMYLGSHSQNNTLRLNHIACSVTSHH